MAKTMMKGNVAAAEAAIRAGLDLFAGYPITPSTETLETLSHRMPEEGKQFIQAESELAGINMIMGASACGARVLTASSGPGMSLKQEGFSYAARNEIPYVCMNVQRWGAGLGRLDSGQSDYLRDTRAGGNGDYRQIVYSPYSIQELVDDMYEAFDVAEKYRIGVLVLSEGFLGQMMEPVELPPRKHREKALDWGLDGTGAVGLKPQRDNAAYLQHLRGKLAQIDREMQRCELTDAEDADYIFVAFGLPARVCEDAVKKLRAAGEKVGLLRPRLVYPYPVEAFRRVNPEVKGFISIETNDLGQMIQDVALSVKKTFTRNVPTYCYAHSMGVPRVQTVIDQYNKIKQGEIREVY
ncbi:MAG TPA: 3-methyl-2-oxobutanoate dehydrogenase subunit beta [Bryobacteraceae bacterium]|nr:3-methyl-2-oxobutanoate dehydrogenase subunit beta [Bryobacteraceae bacterium]